LSGIARPVSRPEIKTKTSKTIVSVGGTQSACGESQAQVPVPIVTTTDAVCNTIDHRLPLERWPRELFASTERADQALGHFLEFGKQDQTLEWIRIDAFPREIVWEGREGREA
jgi:hypothetical protein